MEQFNENLFIPLINVLQDKSLNKKYNFEIDLQNSDLYNLQELTRSAALINFIAYGRQRQSRTITVNNTFEHFIKLADPINIFISNFEEFFGMYIHSKYGRNNFQLFMKQCEKSPVAYPISVFEEGMCIFMQYNREELRNYIYNILTMFYYYTGNNYYEMIKPDEKNSILRPNVYDEYVDINMRTIDDLKKVPKSRQEKLCFLNRRNYDVKTPYLSKNKDLNMNSSYITDTHFQRCILTNRIPNHKPYEMMVGKSAALNNPVFDLLQRESRTDPIIKLTNNKGSCSNPDLRIFSLSHHLNKSCNFEMNTTTTLSSATNDEQNDNNYRHKSFQRTAQIQTNFSNIWSNENRRQLVSLTLITSILNVCIQKLTLTAIIAPKNKVSSAECGIGKLFTCTQNLNDVCDQYNNNLSKASTSKASTQLIKSTKPTIEISFCREISRVQQQNNPTKNQLKFSY